MQIVLSDHLRMFLAHVCSALHKDWERADSTVTTLRCETIIPEEETGQPLNLSKDKCAKK